MVCNTQSQRPDLPPHQSVVPQQAPGVTFHLQHFQLYSYVGVGVGVGVGV